MDKSSFLNRKSLAFFFHIGLWTAHQIFLDQVFNSQTTQVKTSKKLEKNLIDCIQLIIRNPNWTKKQKRIIKELDLKNHFIIDLNKHPILIKSIVQQSNTYPRMSNGIAPLKPDSLVYSAQQTLLVDSSLLLEAPPD